MTEHATIEKSNQTPAACAEHKRDPRTYVPAVDIIENSDELVILAEVAGASAEDIDINYERGTLTIQANVPDGNDSARKYLFREYGVGNYRRTFEVGEGIDASRITAEVNNGLLTLHLPKSEGTRPRKITVQAQ